MKHQRGVALSGLLFWSFVLVMVAVLGMKVVPTYLEYYKTLKDTRAVVSQIGTDAGVADVRKAYEKFAEIDQLTLPSSQLEIYKESGRIVIEFAYDKRIPLFANVSLLIAYKGTTAGN